MKSINLKRLQGRYATLVHSFMNKEKISQKELATKGKFFCPVSLHRCIFATIVFTKVN